MSAEIEAVVPADSTPIPRPGFINVTFSSNGSGSFVDQNPQWFLAEDEDHFTIEWQLVASERTNPDWLVQFGNIVPCHLQDLPHGFTFNSHRVPRHGTEPVTSWRWHFSRKEGNTTPLKDLKGAIAYEVFFSYQLKADPLERRMIGKATEILDVDPSVILPPKETGTPPTPRSDDSVE